MNSDWKKAWSKPTWNALSKAALHIDQIRFAPEAQDGRELLVGRWTVDGAERVVGVHCPFASDGEAIGAAMRRIHEVALHWLTKEKDPTR